MSYTIRPYRDGDAPALADMLQASISEIGAHAYTSEQVEAWAARHPGADRLCERAASGAMLFVAADSDDHPVAFSLLEADGHLDMLYCHPAHTRRGLAEQLLIAAETEAKRLALSRLYTEASELARPAFERSGYTVTRRRDFTIEHAGKDVPIHNYAMEKALV